MIARVRALPLAAQLAGLTLVVLLAGPLALWLYARYIDWLYGRIGTFCEAMMPAVR